MAEANANRRQTPQRYEETEDHRNPPNSVINRDVRRGALRTYLLPIVALVIIAALALIYWANRSPVAQDNPAEVGTTGRQQDVVGERGNAPSTPGGFDPAPRPGSTRDEMERRGASGR